MAPDADDVEQIHHLLIMLLWEHSNPNAPCLDMLLEWLSMHRV